MLMAPPEETEPQSTISTQEDDTLTPSNMSQADSLSGSISGPDRSESGHSSAYKLCRTTRGGLTSPSLSPDSEHHTEPVESLCWDPVSSSSRQLEKEAGTPSLGWFKRLCLQETEPHTYKHNMKD